MGKSCFKCQCFSASLGRKSHKKSMLFFVNCINFSLTVLKSCVPLFCATLTGAVEKTKWSSKSSLLTPSFLLTLNFFHLTSYVFFLELPIAFSSFLTYSSSLLTSSTWLLTTSSSLLIISSTFLTLHFLIYINHFFVFLCLQSALLRFSQSDREVPLSHPVKSSNIRFVWTFDLWLIRLKEQCVRIYA